jgi:hypothetical protein
VAERPHLRVLDLFSGLGGWSAPARERGHHVVRVELEEHLEAEVHADILTLTAADLGGPGAYDLVLASPPCEGFSVMNIGRNWHHDGRPKTPKAELALELVEATLRLIGELQPTYWVLENPRDKLRVLPPVQHLERRTVTYCHYGERRMKPTDLWSAAWPPSLELHPPCRNGDPCHVRAPRGSSTGTQGMGDYWQKSVVPYLLAAAVTDAAERDHQAGSTGASSPAQQLDLFEHLTYPRNKVHERLQGVR